MQDVRIPFALNKTSHLLVEVGDVNRGRQCGCVCPGCMQGVIARHGDVNHWHFAHDQNAEDKPVKECDISFDSCCRQYAIEQILQGGISKLCTPNYIVTEMGYTGPGSEISSLITKSRILDNLIVERSSMYDIKVTLGDFSLLLFFDYKTRKPPARPCDNKVGLLAIDISIIKAQFYSQKSTPGLLSKLLKALIEVNTENKRWLYHPTEKIARVKLREKINQEQSGPVSQQLDSASCSDDEHISLGTGQTTERSGQFTCVLCNVNWVGMEFSDFHCPECKEYIYSRFKADI